MIAELLGQALLAAVGASLAVTALEGRRPRRSAVDASRHATPSSAGTLRHTSHEGFERLLRERLGGPNAGRVRALVLVFLDDAAAAGETASEAESRLAACACPSDLVVKLDGGELAVLLDAVDAQATQRRLERIASCARACAAESERRGGAAATASLGCARLAGTVTASEAIAQAAAALEEARRAGGGCVVHLLPSPTGEARPRHRSRVVAMPVGEHESLRPDALERVRRRLERTGCDARDAWIRLVGSERIADEPQRLALARRLRALGTRVIVEVDADTPPAPERLPAMPCDALLIDAGSPAAPERIERRAEHVAGLVVAARAQGLDTILRLPDDPIAAGRLARCRADWLVCPGGGLPLRSERLWSAVHGFALAA